jgi:hypothetical protein
MTKSVRAWGGTDIVDWLDEQSRICKETMTHYRPECDRFWEAANELTRLRAKNARAIATLKLIAGTDGAEHNSPRMLAAQTIRSLQPEDPQTDKE